jgi:preprotein translocase subunit SecG
MFTFLIIILIIDSLLLATVVLLQAGKGGGLAAMGGGASTDSFFGGRQATTILTKMSWWCGGIFLGLSLILSAMSAGGAVPSSVLEGQVEAPSPVQVPMPAQPGANILQDTSGN